MNLVPWNPWREMSTLQDRINRFFDDSFLSPTRFDDNLDMGSWYPTVDMYDNDDSIVIKAELPGVDKEDVSIDIEDRVLTLKGERNHENEVKEDNYYRKERSYGRFQRMFTLPTDVDPDKINAEFKDGLLKIEIPKPEERKPKAITIH